MSDTLGRYILRVPAATSSTSNLFASTRALSAGAGHIFVTSDINHAANINATGPVFTHQGGDFFRAPVGTPSNPPLPTDIVWMPPIVDEGCLNFRVTFRVDTYGTTALPLLRLRCWMAAGNNASAESGVVLAVGSGPPTDTQNYDSARTILTTGEDIDLEITLRDSDLSAVTTPVTLGYTSTGVPALGEPYAERVCTAWIGFYDIGNNKGNRASVRGIVLSLEAP